MKRDPLYILVIVGLIGVVIVQATFRNDDLSDIKELNIRLEKVKEEVKEQEVIKDLLQKQLKAREIEIEVETQRTLFFKREAEKRVKKREDIRPEVMWLNEDEMLKGFAEVDSIIHR